MNKPPTKKQIEKARRIVNDIHEDIDNKESCKELREVIDTLDWLLMEAQEKLQHRKDEAILEQLKELTKKTLQEAPCVPFPQLVPLPYYGPPSPGTWDLKPYCGTIATGTSVMQQ